MSQTSAPTSLPRTPAATTLQMSRLIREAKRTAIWIETIREELDSPYLTPTWIAEQIETLRRKCHPNKKAIMEFQQCYNHAAGLHKVSGIRLPRADRRMDLIMGAFDDLSNHPEISASQHSEVLDEVEKFIAECNNLLKGFKGAPKIITDTLTGWLEHFAIEKKNLELWAAEVERLATATSTFTQPGPALILSDPDGEHADLDSAAGKAQTTRKAHTETKCKRRNSLCPHDRRID